jgi:AraC-like DNA-binding protein
MPFDLTDVRTHKGAQHDGVIPSSENMHPRWVPVSGPLRSFVSALMAVEVGAISHTQFSIAPHDSIMLTLQLGRGADCIEQKGVQGENTWLTGIRRWTGSFTPAGRCFTLFALLTPLGAVNLLESQPLSAVPLIRARVAQVLDRQITRQLETEIAHAGDLDERLRIFGSWIETRLMRPRKLAHAAVRAGRAAMQICEDPLIPIETLAARERITRRQLERDFGHWIGTSPRHLAQVARLQAVSRHAHQGWSLARIAAEVGFADQSHMTRVVRQLTSLTPQRFVRAATTPISTAFRAATAGGTVYL